MSDASVDFDLYASRSLCADIEKVFGFLADLENHWLIADRFVDVVDLTGPPGARSGGRVRGPLRVHRTAMTRVAFARPVTEMGGTAELSGGTVAHVRWLLDPADGRTVVTLGDDRARQHVGPPAAASRRPGVDAPALRQRQQADAHHHRHPVTTPRTDRRPAEISSPASTKRPPKARLSTAPTARPWRSRAAMDRERASPSSSPR